MVKSVALFRTLPQADFGEIMAELSMDLCFPEDPYAVSVGNKANKLIRFAKENPEHLTASGSSLWDEIVEQAVPLAHTRLDTSVDPWATPDTTATAFVHALKQDGFEITDEGQLRETLPCEADLPQTSDELHDLLDELNMSTLKGHLDQAIEAHTRGEWASANGQLRNILQELFDEIARRIDPIRAKNLKPGINLRQLLSETDPPFFSKPRAEWTCDGKNFIEGIVKRLHSEGPHPGLSDEGDCTFRLHLVLIVAHYYLRHAKSYLADEENISS